MLHALHAKYMKKFNKEAPERVTAHPKSNLQNKRHQTPFWSNGKETTENTLTCKINQLTGQQKN